MKRFALGVALGAFVFCGYANAQKPFALEQILSAPFPSDLTVAKSSNRMAWVFDQQGKRNIWVAEALAFATRHLTKYDEDDGQKLSAPRLAWCLSGRKRLLRLPPEGARIRIYFQRRLRAKNSWRYS